MRKSPRDELHLAKPRRRDKDGSMHFVSSNFRHVARRFLAGFFPFFFLYFARPRTGHVVSVRFARGSPVCTLLPLPPIDGRSSE